MSEQVEAVLNAPMLVPPRGAEVMELPLLLSAGDATALERAARLRGLTVGQMLRRLIREFLHEADGGQCAG